MGDLAGMLGLMLLSSVKFFAAPPMILVSQYSYWESIIILVIGGAAGVLVFYYAGDIAIGYATKLFTRDKKEHARIFTRKNKLIIKAKSRFGLLGLSLLTPVLLSIPVGSIIAAKYFGSDRKTIVYLLMSVVFWAFTLTTFYFYLNDHIKQLFA